jgi:hypothetical protein
MGIKRIGNGAWQQLAPAFAQRRAIRRSLGKNLR